MTVATENPGPCEACVGGDSDEDDHEARACRHYGRVLQELMISAARSGGLDIGRQCCLWTLVGDPVIAPFLPLSTAALRPLPEAPPFPPPHFSALPSVSSARARRSAIDASSASIDALRSLDAGSSPSTAFTADPRTSRTAGIPFLYRETVNLSSALFAVPNDAAVGAEIAMGTGSSGFHMPRARAVASPAAAKPNWLSNTMSSSSKKGIPVLESLLRSDSVLRAAASMSFSVYLRREGCSSEASSTAGVAQVPTLASRASMRASRRSRVSASTASSSSSPIDCALIFPISRTKVPTTSSSSESDLRKNFLAIVAYCCAESSQLPASQRGCRHDTSGGAPGGHWPSASACALAGSSVKPALSVAQAISSLDL
ncbi:hypothetical protein DFJ74DRAFT_770816, partial [Hyaloraphidium curvatum]